MLFIRIGGVVIKKNIKKQFWLSQEEDARLKENAKKTCLSESSYLRMLIMETTPQEQPTDEYYDMLQQMQFFTEKLEELLSLAREDNENEFLELQEEIEKWHKFQLDVQWHFQLPEKESVIWR